MARISYVYVIYTAREPSDFYIGCRTTRAGVSAQDDPYMGSGAWVTRAIAAGKSLRKEVLKEFLDDLAGARRLERIIIEKISWLRRCKNKHWRASQQIQCICGKNAFYPNSRSRHYPIGTGTNGDLYVEPFSLFSIEFEKWPSQLVGSVDASSRSSMAWAV